MENNKNTIEKGKSCYVPRNFMPGRRTFIKTTAFVAGGLALSAPALRAFAPYDEKKKNKMQAYEGQWVPSTCQGCTTWCAIEIFVQGGRAVKVRGNQNSLSNNGFVCPKGHLLIKQEYDPDRIKVPMKRTNPLKGRNVDPQFIPITWEEALKTIADKMLELRNNNEPHKFVLFRGRYSSYLTEFPYTILTKVFGSPNGIAHSSLCAEAEKFGPYYTEGYWDYRDYDLINTKYVIFWGCDPISSNRQIPNVINKLGNLSDNATLVTIDPRFSSTAAKSHEWMPIKQGEDGALASAFAHIILTEGLWNKEFVGDFKDGVNRFVAGAEVDESTFEEIYTYGLIKWWNLELKDKTPEWASEVTKLDKGQILRVARGLGNSAPKAIVWLGPGACMHVRGGYTSMAIHALNGLLGSVDNEGGTARSSSVSTKKLPDYATYQDEIAQEFSHQKKIDQRGYKQFPALTNGKSGGGVVTNNAANAILAEDPYDIKMAIGYWNNYNFSGTAGQRWDEALKKIPFFVHITTNASEMTNFADIVLPAAFSAVEKYAVIKSKANLYTYLTIQQPVVERLWDVKADESEIMWELAQTLKNKGFSKIADYFENEFKDPDTNAKPTTAEEFALYATKFFAKPSYDKIGGWEEFKRVGIVNSDKYTFKTKWGNFDTVSKKFEFYSQTLKNALNSHATNHSTTIDDILATCKYIAKGELAFVPHYEPPYRYGDYNEYPFDFVDYKSKLNREGRSQNLTWYYEFHKVDTGNESWEDYLMMNPVDGRNLGLKTGDLVKVTSPQSSIQVKVKLWEGIRPSVVAKCYGQGHSRYGKIASLDFKRGIPRGGNNNDIMPDEYERLSGSTVRNGGFFGVKIEKISGIGMDESKSTKFDFMKLYPNPAVDYSISVSYTHLTLPTIYSV